MGLEPKMSDFKKDVFRQGCQSSILYAKKNIFGNNKFLKKKYVFFRKLCKEFLDLEQKSFDRVVKTLFNLSRGTFWEETTWKKIHIFFTLFRTLSENFFGL